MKFYLIALTLAALVSACASGPAKKTTKSDEDKPFKALCMHPFVLNGQPFPLQPGDRIEGDRVYAAGGQGYLTGAACIVNDGDGVADSK